jgi:hypothetical protein
MGLRSNFYHVMGNTYGTWLPGSPKGFRTRHHREHIDGDYKHPPPRGKYERRHAKARSLMSRDAVFLTVEQRSRALDEFLGSLRRRGFEPEVMSVDRVHFHLLCRFPDCDPRRWVGLAKRECSHYCKQSGHGAVGGIWAVRAECKPIADVGHFHRTVGYILDHEAAGAAVYRRITAPPLWDFDPDDLLVGP